MEAASESGRFTDELKLPEWWSLQSQKLVEKNDLSLEKILLVINLFSDEKQFQKFFSQRKVISLFNESALENLKLLTPFFTDLEILEKICVKKDWGGLRYGLHFGSPKKWKELLPMIDTHEDLKKISEDENVKRFLQGIMKAEDLNGGSKYYYLVRWLQYSLKKIYSNEVLEKNIKKTGERITKEIC